MSAFWVPIVYQHYLDRYPALIVSGAALALALMIDAIRLSSGPINDWFFRKLGFLIRESERKSLNTSTLFIFSIFLAVLLFEKRVAVMCLLFLAVGDPIAAMVGTAFGRHRILGKSFEGSAACFLACFIVAQMQFPVHIALWAALCATLFELLSAQINDNISIPLFSGIAVTLLLENAKIYRPLRYAFIVFQVYLLFVILSSISAHVLNHIMLWRYKKEFAVRFRGRRCSPSVSIIKPAVGASDETYINYSAFCQQEYSGEYELIFVTPSDHAPSIQLIERLRKEFPTCCIRVATAAHSAGHAKMDSMVSGEALARNEIVVFSDDGISPDPRHLQRLVQPFCDPGVGLVMAAPIGSRPGSLAAALDAFVSAYLSLTVYYPIAYFEKLATAIGSTLAIRRSVLDRIGGLQAVSHHLADDHALGRLVREMGCEIVLLDRPARLVRGRDSMKDFLRRTHRRALSFQRYVRQAYPLYLLQTGIFHSVILLALRRSFPALSAVLLVITIETLSISLFYRLHMRDRTLLPYLWAVPILQLLSPLIWVSAYFSKLVTWGAEKYYVNSEGIITRIRSDPGQEQPAESAIFPQTTGDSVLQPAACSGFLGGAGQIQIDHEGNYLGHDPAAGGMGWQGMDGQKLPSYHWLHRITANQQMVGFTYQAGESGAIVEVILPIRNSGRSHPHRVQFSFRADLFRIAPSGAIRFRLIAGEQAVLPNHSFYYLMNSLTGERTPWRAAPLAPLDLTLGKADLNIDDLPTQRDHWSVYVSDEPLFLRTEWVSIFQRAFIAAAEKNFGFELIELGNGGLSDKGLPPADRETNPQLAVRLFPNAAPTQELVTKLVVLASTSCSLTSRVIEGLLRAAIDTPSRYLVWCELLILPTINPDGIEWNIADCFPSSGRDVSNWDVNDNVAPEAIQARRFFSDHYGHPVIVIDLSHAPISSTLLANGQSPQLVRGHVATNDNKTRAAVTRVIDTLARLTRVQHTKFVEQRDGWAWSEIPVRSIFSHPSSAYITINVPDMDIRALAQTQVSGPIRSVQTRSMPAAHFGKLLLEALHQGLTAESSQE